MFKNKRQQNQCSVKQFHIFFLVGGNEQQFADSFFFDIRNHLPFHIFVKTGKWFIHQNAVTRCQQRSQDGDPLLLELNDEELDKALRIIKEENGVLLPTVTGMLLIGKGDKIEELSPLIQRAEPLQILVDTGIRGEDCDCNRLL